MTEILTLYREAFAVFFAGMPSDTADLAIIGFSVAVGVFFLALPYLVIRKGCD